MIVKPAQEPSLKCYNWFPLLECMVNVVRALRKHNLSLEGRNSVPDSLKTSCIKKGGRRKKVEPLSSVYDFRKELLNMASGRVLLNGSSDVTSLFTLQGNKGINQDAMIVWENFGSRARTVLCSVFDGHGPYGHLVAKCVRDSLPHKLNEQWEVIEKANDMHSEIRPSVDSVEDIKPSVWFETLKGCFINAFKAMDSELRMHTNFDCFCSGTTAVVLVRQGQNLIIGNIGDSRAVMGTRDKNNSLIAVQLTVDLKPNLPVEKERIKRCKGRVFALKNEPDIERVWLPKANSPGLSMTRAFGDFCLKDFGVISVPDILCKRISDKDEFVILATDGIWDVLSNDQVVNIVSSCSKRSLAARNVVSSAILVWRSKYPGATIDDCAVVCLFLDSKEDSHYISKYKTDVCSYETDDVPSKPLLQLCGNAK